MGETTDQLKADIEYRRERMSGTVDAIEDRVVPGRIIRRRSEAARGWMGQARTRVMGPPQRIKAQVGAVPGQATASVHQLAENVTGLPEQISGQTRGAPLVAGSIAFGVGALIALLAPETPAEQHLAATLEPQIATLTDAAKETAHAATDSAKESVQQSVDELKDVASEHVSKASEQAHDAVEQVKNTAKETAPRSDS
jgi:gas vesicle protein